MEKLDNNNKVPVTSTFQLKKRQEFKKPESTSVVKLRMLNKKQKYIGKVYVTERV